MNYNIIGYITYLTMSIYIIVHVGKICYRNGNIYVEAILHGNKELCIKINRILLNAYYLLNVGYALVTLVYWETIMSLPSLISNIATKLGTIIGTLSVLHYINILIITKYIRKLLH